MIPRSDLKLASLDGGGARSFSQLVILKHIMKQVMEEKYPNGPETDMRPCEHFEMIGGSDTGGLLAIMFSRLRMSVAEAEDEFSSIVEKVYIPQFDNPFQRTQRLRKTIEEMLTKMGLEVDAKLETEWERNHCAGYALVLSAVDLRQRICLRSYRTPKGLPSDISVVDAMLATCASNTIFAPVSVGVGFNEKTYVSADLGANNPVGELISEAHAFYGADSKVAVLVSLGSGHPGSISMPTASDRTTMNNVYRQILSDSESVANEMQARMRDTGIYFRLSVGQWARRNESTTNEEPFCISAQASGYLQDEETIATISGCVHAIIDNNGRLTLEKLKHSSAPRPTYKPIPMRAQHYIHRQAPFSRLTQAMFSKPHDQAVVVVAGMAGCGKTQLVSEALRRYDPTRNEHFDYTFFVDASSERSIKSDLMSHVQLITAPDGSRIDFADAMQFFQNSDNRKWLIVYDNADETRIDLGSLLPKCGHGVIVITTRNQLLGKLASEGGYLELDVMSEAEAVELILQCAGRGASFDAERGDAARIASKLGYLPVALTQAGCYMFDTGCLCGEYLKLLSDVPEELMDIPSGDRQNDGAYVAFDLIYTRLSDQTKKFMHLLSFYHFADFPISVIYHAAEKSFLGDPSPFTEGPREIDAAIKLLRSIFLPTGKWSKPTLGGIIPELRKYSLVSITTTPVTRFIRVHPLIRDWAFDRLKCDLRVDFRDAACRLLVCTDARNIRLYLQPHMESVMLRPVTPEISLNDRAAFAVIMRAAHQRKAAQMIWLPIYDSLHEKDPVHPDVATAALHYGCLDDDPALTQQEIFVRKAISILNSAEGFGPKHIRTLEAMGALSATFSRQGRHNEAVALQRDVLREMRIQVSADHPMLLEEERRAARIFSRRGNYSEAEDMRHQVLNKTREMLGDNHLKTLDAMYQVALIYNSQGRHIEAEALLLRVLEGQKRLKPTQKEIFCVTHALSMIYSSQGRSSDAEAIQAQLANGWRSQLGCDVAAIITPAIMNLAASEHSACGRHAEAISLQQEILKGHKTRLGDEHELTITAMNALALMHYANGSYLEALNLWLTVSEARKRQAGGESLVVAACMHQISWAYCKLGRLEKAKEACSKAERVRKAVLGVGHPDYRSTAELVKYLGINLA